MKFWKISFLLASTAVMTLSCKKDDGEVNVKYMEGSINLDVPAFVLPGYTQTFPLDDLMTVTRDDGGEVGYYVTDPFTEDKDTLRTSEGQVLKDEYVLTVADDAELGDYTLTVTSYGGGYVGRTGTADFTVVRPGLNGESSLTGFDIQPSDLTFYDARDGRNYYYTILDDTRWMRQNLAWEGAGQPCGNSDAMSDIFGRYYTWEEAQTACPEGWRLPSDEDWAKLAELYAEGGEPGTDFTGLAGDLMENVYFNGTRMWEYWSEVDVTNAARLSVLPVGYAVIEDGEYEFSPLYEYAAFWTSDENNGSGVFRYIVERYDIVYYGEMSKTDVAFPVRCVSDVL